MNYWEAVLQEVLHRHDEAYTFYFTNVRELESLQQHANDASHKAAKKPKAKTSNKNQLIYFLGAKFDNKFLTERELLCLRALYQVSTNKAAAEQLNLSVRTIEYYVSTLKNKFDCVNKQQLLSLLMGHALLQ